MNAGVDVGYGSLVRPSLDVDCFRSASGQAYSCLEIVRTSRFVDLEHQLLDAVVFDWHLVYGRLLRCHGEAPVGDRHNLRARCLHIEVDGTVSIYALGGYRGAGHLGDNRLERCLGIDYRERPRLAEDEVRLPRLPLNVDRGVTGSDIHMLDAHAFVKQGYGRL